MKTIFSYTSYKTYLRDALDSERLGKGVKSRFALGIGCQPSFLSQVMNGKPDLTLEQALRGFSFLGLSGEESEYFLNLLQQAKASSPELKEYFQGKLNAGRADRLSVEKKLETVPALGLNEQVTYYSSWLYSAIHILSSLSETNTRRGLAQHLKVSLKEISEKVAFLLDCEILVEDRNGKLSLGKSRIHLSKRSPLVSKHHENWRRRALVQCESSFTESLHYSMVMGISESDSIRIRDLIVRMTEKTEKILTNSKESKAFALTLDFFPLLKVRLNEGLFY